MKKTSIIFLLLTISLIVVSCQSVSPTPIVELSSPSPLNTETPQATLTVFPTLTVTPSIIPTITPAPTSTLPFPTPNGAELLKYSPDRIWVAFEIYSCPEFDGACLLLKNIETGIEWQTGFYFLRLGFSGWGYSIRYWNVEQNYLIYSLFSTEANIFAVDRFDLVTGEIQEIVSAEPLRNLLSINYWTGELYHFIAWESPSQIHQLSSSGELIETYVMNEIDMSTGWVFNLGFVDENTTLLAYMFDDHRNLSIIMLNLVDNKYYVITGQSSDFVTKNYIEIIYKDEIIVFVEDNGEEHTITPDHIETYNLQIINP